MKELLEYAQYTTIGGVSKDTKTADSVLNLHVLWLLGKKNQNNKTPSA